MIQPDKYQQALRAMHVILTRARWMAHEADATQLAELLDAAEILPKYIAQPKDMTEHFEATISDIANEHPSCAQLVDAFDDSCSVAW